MSYKSVQHYEVPNVNSEGMTILYDPTSPALDIVFIHGFTGHPKRTWTHKKAWVLSDGGNEDDSHQPSKFRKIFHSTNHNPTKVLGTSQIPFVQSGNGVYWPFHLVPKVASNARILTFGYDTRIRHWLVQPTSRSTVYDIAWDLLLALEAHRRKDNSRPLVFIAHSLGGILVKECLRRSRGCSSRRAHLRFVFEATKGVIFFGTPHGGAEPRTLVHRVVEKVLKVAGLSVNEQVVDTLLPSSDRLKELRNEFNPMAAEEEWTIYSFQEQYGIKLLNGNKVVDDTSSCLGDTEIEITQHIARDHMEMCRFSSGDDVEFLKVAAALERIIQCMNESPIPSVEPTFASEQAEPKSTMKPKFEGTSRADALKSLRFLEMDERRTTIKQAHLETCHWLFENCEYLDWLDPNKLDNHHGFLWIKGKPGTGKSTLMKYAFANAKKTMSDFICLSFFFNARGTALQKTTLGMYRSLLYQLLMAIPETRHILDTLPHVESEVLEQEIANFWTLERLQELLEKAVLGIGRQKLAFYIDALDECNEDQIRDMVRYFEDLGNLAVASQTRFLICLSSRHYPHITIAKSLQFALETKVQHYDDISKYLRTQLRIGGEEEASEIRNEIRGRSSGIFIWVVLVVGILNKAYDHGRIYELREKLKEIPDDLHGLFKDILTRDKQNIEDMRCCIQWILFGRRPLMLRELFIAIVHSRPATNKTEKLFILDRNLKFVSTESMIRFILSCSKGLAEVVSATGTVQFIHESVRDFFLHMNGYFDLWPELDYSFRGLGHDFIKNCCVEWVNWATNLPLSSFDPRQSPTASFIDYTASNALFHAEAAAENGISQTQFLQTFPFDNWNRLYHSLPANGYAEMPNGETRLYILVKWNLPYLIRTQLRVDPRTEMVGGVLRYPVFVALAKGNLEALLALLVPRGNSNRTVEEETGDILLHQHQNIRQSAISCVRNGIFECRNGQSPLSFFSEMGDADIVQMLLDAGQSDPNSQDSEGFTPIEHASMNKHANVVRILLPKVDLKPKSVNFLLSTMLNYVAMSKDANMIKTILEYTKDHDRFAETLYTVLYTASTVAVDKATPLLDSLQGGIHSTNMFGDTALSWCKTYEYHFEAAILLKAACTLPELPEPTKLKKLNVPEYRTRQIMKTFDQDAPNSSAPRGNMRRFKAANISEEPNPHSKRSLTPFVYLDSDMPLSFLLPPLVGEIHRKVRSAGHQ